MHAYVKSMLTFFNYFSTINNTCIYVEQYMADTHNIFNRRLIYFTGKV